MFTLTSNFVLEFPTKSVFKH